MNKFKIYPFQKNKYFYGKLLTVRDFQLEQKYNDEKRCMINRIMFGSGIATGLKVTSVDEQTIVIEPGMAIDNQGREIVIAEHVTQKLSFIKGFKNDSDCKNLYLCLAYNEQGKERVYSAVGTSNESEEAAEYNRIQENYELVLKEDVENVYINKSIDVSMKNVIIYEDEDILIKKSYPGFINQGEIFEVTLEIEKRKTDVHVELDYLLKSESVHPISEEEKDLEDIRVSFKEPLEDKSMRYETRFLMAAGEKAEENSEILLNKSDFVLKVNGTRKNLEENISFNLKIVKGNKKRRLLKEFNEASTDERIELDSFDYIYLAKIEIIQLAASYIINKVTTVPFKQYIYNNNQLKNISLINDGSSLFNIKTVVKTEMIDSKLNPDIDVKYNNELNEFKFDFKIPKNQINSQSIATGTIDFNITETSILGKSIISEEIEHGLGLGPVYIQVGVEEAQDAGFMKEERIYYGDSQAFLKSEFEAEQNVYLIGSVVFPERGTFRVGVRLEAFKKSKSIRIRWWGYRNLPNND